MLYVELHCDYDELMKYGMKYKGQLRTRQILTHLQSQDPIEGETQRASAVRRVLRHIRETNWTRGYEGTGQGRKGGRVVQAQGAVDCW